MNIESLKRELSALRDQRLFKEMSDDFAYTNGSIDRIDAQIRRVQIALDQATRRRAA
jgi:hypothetical protein